MYVSPRAHLTHAYVQEIAWVEPVLGDGSYGLLTQSLFLLTNIRHNMHYPTNSEHVANKKKAKENNFVSIVDIGKISGEITIQRILKK